jgi:hypothetical protein
MRNFTVGIPGTLDGGLTTLETPLTLNLSNGSYNAGTAGLQLSPLAFSGASLAGSTGAGVRAEYHESGSVEGILDLANDQIGYAGGISGTPILDPFTARNPVGGNPIWVNRNRFTSVGTLSGYGIGTSNYNTYDPATYNSAGKNLQGGQNRVQMAISDVVPTQGFSVAGAGTFNAAPGAAGYGKGNSLLSSVSTSGLGQPGARAQLVDQGLLNMPTTNIDPATGSNYAGGPWNTGGVNNLTTKTVAITATLFAANPGTGLTNINKTDAQWLQTTGRLKNGIDFNMTERDPNSGTRNTAAANTGVDPSWAVGENDGGNGYANGVPESTIGASMKFSGKTAGGGLLRPTIQNNRMAVGVLGMSDAIGSVKNNTNTTPLRALALSNTVDGQTPNYVQATTATVTDGSYIIWQKEQYITVRSPDPNYASDQSAKGDPNGDIIKLRDNVLNSVNIHFPNPASFNDPADQLIATSFLLPQFMLVDKSVDGGATTDVSSVMVNGKSHADWRTDALNPANGVTSNFDTTAAINVTAGSSAKYGVTSTTGLAGGVTAIPITAQDSSGNATGTAAAPAGNYLFGNFNQTGVRDFDAIQKAQVAQAALFTGGGAAAEDVNNAGVDNGTRFAGISTALDNMNAHTGPSKGDLVVMGDFNGDGKFDGKDLYMMARGAAIADARGGTTLTATASSFGTALHSAVLVKNAALDWMNTHATAQQKIEASANSTSDPTGANAFNKFDVNRDGLMNRSDAQIVDNFVGMDYRNLSNQLSATIATDGTINPAATQRPISLVDAELNDTGDITHITTNQADKSDFQLIREALGTSLRDGDSNFDGQVNTADFDVLAGNFNASGLKWSQGDYNFDGIVNALDFNAMASNYGLAPGQVPALGSLVPEPGSISLLLAGLLVARRTSRGRRRIMRNFGEANCGRE